jgi:hypothetical protein
MGVNCHGAARAFYILPGLDADVSLMAIRGWIEQSI